MEDSLKHLRCFGLAIIFLSEVAIANENPFVEVLRSTKDRTVRAIMNPPERKNKDVTDVEEATNQAPESNQAVEEEKLETYENKEESEELWNLENINQF